MTQLETRSVAPGLIKIDDAVRGRITVQPTTYDVVDDYDTTWSRGVFAASVEKRAPRFAWDHNQSEPLGIMVDGGYAEGDSGPTMVFQLDLEPEIPLAIRAFKQIQSGTIDQYSAGFRRELTEPERRSLPGVTPKTLRFLRCQLDEVSAVMHGAVPGTKTLAIRSGGKVSRSAVLAIAELLQEGKISTEDAISAIQRSAVPSDETDIDDKATDTTAAPVTVPEIDAEALLAQADAVLGARAWRR